jgi:hypothetical protein
LRGQKSNEFNWFLVAAAPIQDKSMKSYRFFRVGLAGALDRNDVCSNYSSATDTPTAPHDPSKKSWLG